MVLGEYISERSENTENTEQKITFDGSKIRINEKDITGFVREHSLIMKSNEMPYLKLVLEIPFQSRNLKTSANISTSFTVDIVDCDK